mmetsp:Transcript_101750/g.164041  ORF Transcript_101750/g.164041 Transcript_101750/m.164041 type:complete len:427 (-) Transcript_101750:395-1675(-)
MKSALLLAYVGSTVGAQKSKRGEAPTGNKFLCAGCVAAVKSAHHILGRHLSNEGKVQELLEDDMQQVCSASNFEEVEQTAQWSLPPPETARACVSFLQRFGEIDVAEMVVASKTLDIDHMVKSVCDVSSRVCTLGTAHENVDAHRKEDVEKKGQGERGIEKIEPNEEVSREEQAQLNARLLWAASVKASPREVEEALAAGAEIDGVADPNGGRTALMAACLAGKHKTVNTLLKAGANWRIGENDGYTCLHGAGFQGRSKVAAVAISHGVPVTDVHTDGYSPLHRACWGDSKNHAETVRVMVVKGKANINAVTSKGVSPLLAAASASLINTHLIKVVIELGANVSAVDANGDTAMHKIIQGGVMDTNREQAVALLVRAGVDLSESGSSDSDGDLRKLAWQLGYATVVEEALADASLRGSPVRNRAEL